MSSMQCEGWIEATTPSAAIAREVGAPHDLRVLDPETAVARAVRAHAAFSKASSTSALARSPMACTASWKPAASASSISPFSSSTG